MNTQDYDYLHLLKKGHQHGLRHFMELHMRTLTYFAQNIVKDTTVAEEIVQDAFVNVWNRREQFESTEHVKAFLYLATRNACINHLKTSYTRHQANAEELSENLPLSDNDVLTKMIHAETITHIHAELERLPPQQAAVFRLSYFEGFTTDEICEALGISTNAVFLARSRATQALRSIFKHKSPMISRR
ncbi:RNA polymerase sigma factor [Parapedobacter sp. 10938]|uniref:RNA polymerase sigma factor n=1 Tax=Parapedobacter flavus TaxID=3110225 RepID=UPI002DBFD78D|nr:sigma-70 family RNA polymerase sigma factor [Parapedobacter sp. 10938]MEC3881646.1 sigma-70 family RNA polymerase sigma factor [Parapedobacter sp. 10938]